MEEAYYSPRSEGLLLCEAVVAPPVALCCSGARLRTGISVLRNRPGEPAGRTQSLAELPRSPSALSSISASAQRSPRCSNSVIKQRASSVRSFHIRYNCFKITAELVMYLGKSKWFQRPRGLLVMGSQGIKRASRQPIQTARAGRAGNPHASPAKLPSGAVDIISPPTSRPGAPPSPRTHHRLLSGAE